MFSIELDGKRHTARTHLEALELLTGAGYADELVSKVLVMAYEDGSTDVLSSLADSAGKSHDVTVDDDTVDDSPRLTEEGRLALAYEEYYDC